MDMMNCSITGFIANRRLLSHDNKVFYTTWHFSQCCKFYSPSSRIPYVFRRESGSHGALSHPGHNTAQIPSNLASGRRSSRFQFYIWGNKVCKTLPPVCTTTCTRDDLQILKMMARSA